MQYRSDIDGLRAVAVLPIVVFHAGMSALPGGFIGVDIFFVISGFLITSIIVREIDGGHFSLLDFYHRRVARIFPALFAMLAAAFVAALFIMLPQEIRAASREIAASLLFASNLWFWRTANYFDVSSDEKLVLHTWSLGVEEQFYLLFPVFLLACHRYGKIGLKYWIYALGAVSFVLSVVAVEMWPTAAFYLLPSRAWELALGAALVFAPRPVSGWAARSMGLAGLGLIVAGLLALDGGSAFPGAAALLPAGGAALLILSGPGSISSNVLSFAPLRFVGQISYSLYLWHWPIIVLYRLHQGQPAGALPVIGLIAASLAAAVLSRHLIEVPFLRMLRGARAGRVVAGGALASIVLAGAVLWVGRDVEDLRPYPGRVAEIARTADYANSPASVQQFRTGSCFLGDTAAAADFDAVRCATISETRRNVLVMGDSHAAQLWRAIAERHPAWNVMQATAAGCRPLLQTTGAAGCVGLMNKAFGEIVPRVDAVVIAGRWEMGDVEPLARTVRAIKAGGIDITVIGPTVEYRGQFPFLLARAVWHDKPGMVREGLRSGKRETDRRLGAAMAGEGVRYVSLWAIVCPEACRLYAPDGTPMLFDDSHFTLNAARFVASEFKLH